MQKVKGMHFAASSGNDLVSRKSILMQGLARLPAFKRIAVIDDNDLDAQHLTATLYLLLGREVAVAHYRSIAVALDRTRKERPDLIFLDDYMPPLDRAESSIRSLVRFGIHAPIVIMSGQLNRARRNELAKLNPIGILDKDEINTFAVGEVLLRLLPPEDGNTPLA